MGLSSWLFGSNKMKTANVLSPEQIALQNQLMGDVGSIRDMDIQSAYNPQSGGMINRLMHDFQNQANNALAQNQHSNRFHSSGQQYRNANIQNQYDMQGNQAMFNWMQEQQKLQQQARENQIGNQMNRYGIMNQLANTALQRQKENMMTQKPGALSQANALMQFGSNVGSMFGGGK